jgi:hypothetical protein
MKNFIQKLFEWMPILQSMDGEKRILAIVIESLALLTNQLPNLIPISETFTAIVAFCLHIIFGIFALWGLLHANYKKNLPEEPTVSEPKKFVLPPD